MGFKTSVYFLPLINCVFLSADHWCSPCVASCRSPTSSVWSSHWRLTPTFTTSKLEKDRVWTGLRVNSAVISEGFIHLPLTHHRISVSVGTVTRQHGAVVHWSRWRSLIILIMATVLTSACADLATEHIQPILNQPNISQVGACIRSYSETWLLNLFVLTFAVFLSFSSISSGWRFSLWFQRSLRLLTGSSLLSKTTSVSGKSRLIESSTHTASLQCYLSINDFYVSVWRWEAALRCRSACYRFQYWSFLMPSM